MPSLNQPEKFSLIDKENAMGSIRLLADQIEQAWSEVNALEAPPDCSLAKNVVVCGMGGSALGARIVDSLKESTARTPIEIFTGYNLPNYVGPNSLVILSSYSGNTEETISAAHQAISKKAQIFIIATGGELAAIAKKENLPSYIFTPTNNPSNQPRLSLGYSVAAILAILAKCQFISLTNEEIETAIKSSRKFISDFGPNSLESTNPAKALARGLKNKIPIFVASEHLIGSTHAFKNQINEGAKTFSTAFDLPELNHHLLEGLKNPALAKEFLKFVFIESDLYSDRVKIRYPITENVVEQNEVEFVTYKALSAGRLAQAFEILILGSFTHYYLAMLYEVDPTPIPWVDYFKEKLANT